MKAVLIWFALALALAAGARDPAEPQKQQRNSKTAVKKAPGPRKTEAHAVPKDAVEIEPGVYRWKDAAGKTWIIRRSPFGLLKGEEPVTSQPGGREGEDVAAEIKVVEEGDELRFERRTPFGVSRWKKKKTELDELEQRAWEHEQKRREAGGPEE